MSENLKKFLDEIRQVEYEEILKKFSGPPKGGPVKPEEVSNG